ncbi:BACON domain-containing protein [Arundinibacter roseus]|uniref:BACON domain-containing protein n=1 Tax=Arundinibacter roseus TaxID=2070510 RepID=UPI00140471B6|nr:BACON domain-containing carbohydrate-binding protein [Arundinibacter roseus]
MALALTPAFSQTPGWQSFALNAPAGDLVDFDFDKDGKIWLISRRGTGGLMMFDGKKVTQYSITDQALRNENFRSIAVDDAGNKWITTYDKLLQFDAKNTLFVNYITFTSTAKNLGLTSAESSNGITWVHDSNSGGLLRIEKGVIVRHSYQSIIEKIKSKANISQNGDIELVLLRENPTLKLDKAGRIFLTFAEWRSTGFCFYDGKDITIIQQTDEEKLGNLLNASYNAALTQGKADTVFLRSEGGARVYFGELTRESIFDQSGCVWTAGSGNRPLLLHLCSGSSKLYSSLIKNFPSHRLFEEYREDRPTSFLIDGKNRPLVFYGGKLAHLVDQKWHVFDSSNSPIPDQYSIIKKKIAPDGSLWMLSSNTLTRYSTTEQPDYLLNVSPDLINPIPRTGGTYVLTVKSNVSWKVSFEGYLNAKVSPTEGKGDGKITVTIDPRASILEQRFPVEFGMVSIIGQGQIAETVLRMTNQAPAIFVTSSIPSPVPDAGGTYNIAVSSQTNWESSSADNWITLDTKSGTGNKSIEVKVADNPTSVERTGKITVSAKGETKDLLVTQSGKQFKISFSATTIPNPVPELGGTYRLDVAANTPWEIVSSDSWLVLDTKSGTGNKPIEVKVAVNPTFTDRTAKITLTSKYDVRIVNIRQLGKVATIDFFGNIPRPFPGEGGKYEIIVDANSDWKVTTLSNWMKFTPMSGPSGKTTVSLEILMNPSTTQSRKGGFGVTPTGAMGETFVTLEQGKLIVTALEPDAANERYKVYPNPVGNELTIEINTLRPDIRWNIYDMNGQAVQSGSVESTKTTINTQKLPAGAYVLSMSHENEIMRSVRVVKE